MKSMPVFAYSVPTASIHPKQTLLLFNFFLVPEPDISLDFFFFKYLSTLSPSNKVKSYSAGLFASRDRRLKPHLTQPQPI